MPVLSRTCDFRFPGVTLGTLLIIGVLMPVTTPAQSTMPSSSVLEETPADAGQTLIITLQHLEELLASVDQLVVHLAQTAQGALTNADAVQDMDERVRYEALGLQANARLIELQNQRFQIVQLMAHIRAKLGASSVAK